MKNDKTEPIPVMDYRQYRRVRRLVHECCNYIDGNCIALDDGEECVCVQSISYSLLCRWFRAAVLPQDKELETALFHRLNAKKCAVCEALFTPGSNRAKYCPECAARMKRINAAKRKLETVQQQLATAQEEVKKPFPKETELNEKIERLSELNALLNMDEKGNETIMADEDIGREGNSTDSRDAVEEKELPETADRIHKPSILERLKQEKAQQNTAEQTVTQKTAKKKHEQEL